MRSQQHLLHCLISSPGSNGQTTHNKQYLSFRLAVEATASPGSCSSSQPNKHMAEKVVVVVVTVSIDLTTSSREVDLKTSSSRDSGSGSRVDSSTGRSHCCSSKVARPALLLLVVVLLPLQSQTQQP
jgi:hypothetical protein